jgi:hypothetical protein
MLNGGLLLRQLTLGLLPVVGVHGRLLLFGTLFLPDLWGLFLPGLLSVRCFLLWLPIIGVLLVALPIIGWLLLILSLLLVFFLLSIGRSKGC